MLYPQCQGKDINWSHIIALYLRNGGAATGLNLIPKLKYERVSNVSFKDAGGLGRTGMCMCTVHVRTVTNCKKIPSYMYLSDNCDTVN